MKNKVIRFFALLTIDELSEANRIIKFLGIIFGILAVLYFFNLVSLNSLVIISIALSGIFFVLADICEHYSINQSKKEAIDAKIRYKKMKILKFGRFILHFLAITSLIIGPYINFNYDIILIERLDRLSNSLALIAIGLTVFKIGLDYSMKKTDAESKLIDEITELYRELEQNNSSKDKS